MFSNAFPAKQESEEEYVNPFEAILRERKENEAKKDIAKLRCKTKWDHSIEACESHAYLIKKRIKPIYCRQHGEDLIIPIYDHFGEIQSLQSIHPDGFKLYEEGSSYKGGYLPLGEKINGTLRLCEGYATGCSIYEAIGEPVFVCFTANNLIHIAKWIRKKYPHFPIQICADDDRRTEKKIGKNIGLIAAIHAAKEINATVIYPDFTLIPHSENLTDFNDLFCVSGIEAVENQLLKGVSK